MGRSPNSQTNKLLGYPDDARLLIINADDFGMCHAVNFAIYRTLTEGVVQSTTLMVPCPWALHAMHLLRDNPGIAFGVHLTTICDGEDYRWGPLSARESVPSLVDESGYFYRYDRMAEFLAQARVDELDVEFRAQIDAVLKSGLKPTHLDWHSLRFGTRTDIYDLMFTLAKEYGLALRVRGREMIDKVQREGLPSNDHDFLDSYSVETTDKPALYARLLSELPAGLSEWAVHPAIDDAEYMAIEPGSNQERQTDFDSMVSSEVRDAIEREGIVLLSYQPLQALWQSKV